MKNIEIVNKLVRPYDIEKIENKGGVVTCDAVEVSKEDISKNRKNVKQLRKWLQALLYSTVNDYDKLSYDKVTHCKKKVAMLVDIEDIVKTIGTLDGYTWKSIWEQAKMSTLHGMIKSSRIGEPNLQGCVAEYLRCGQFEDLCYIETALMEELKKFNAEYGKFYVRLQKRRIMKNKTKGGFMDGYYLRSVEYSQAEESDLNK